MLPPPPRSTLFPYTTLFRSLHPRVHAQARRADLRRRHHHPQPPLPRRLALARHGRDCEAPDRKSTRLNSSHRTISYAVFCLKKKKKKNKKKKTETNITRKYK